MCYHNYCILSIINSSQVRQLHGHSPMALTPTSRALKCTNPPIGKLREAHRGQTVVGIDLDMSSCSMSYRINNADPMQRVDLAPGSSTIPIVLLLSKFDGQNCRIESIGWWAKDSLITLFSGDVSKYHYFELNLWFYRHKVNTTME